MARYTRPRWKQAPGGHWWYYGDMHHDNWATYREWCYAVVDYGGRPIGVREPGGEIDGSSQHFFPTLESAKVWVEIEASNHV